tara:strand:- start:709 stop:1653 length:945 start_codon:yes stop_codon:yes gene_type:complete
MSEETQNVDAGTDGKEYFDLGKEVPIQSDSVGEEQAPNPVENLEAFDNNLLPSENQNEAPQDSANAPKGDEGRFEYWQSRYDQKASEFSKLEEQLGQYQKIAPIAEYIQENPNVLQNVARSLSGDTPQVPAQAESEGLPQKPQRPVKPANYDPSEAYMDVESASYKYRQSMDDYRDGIIDYTEQMDTYRVQQAEAQQQALQQRQAQYQQQRELDNMQNDLVNKYGYEPTKAKEFIQYYSSPDSLSLDNLVRLDKLRSAPSKAEVEQRQRVESMKQNQQKLSVPPPASAGSGYSEPQLTEEDAFNLALLRNRKTV